MFLQPLLNRSRVMPAGVGWTHPLVTKSTNTHQKSQNKYLNKPSNPDQLARVKHTGRHPSVPRIEAVSNIFSMISCQGKSTENRIHEGTCHSYHLEHNRSRQSDDFLKSGEMYGSS